MKKVFSVSQVRDLLNQAYAEKITISRCAEILNECVPKQLALPTDRHKSIRSATYGTRYPADGSKPFLNRGMMKDFESGWDACIEHIKIMNEPAKTGDKSDEG